MRPAGLDSLKPIGFLKTALSLLGKPRSCWKAIRPKTLLAGASPVIIGISLAIFPGTIDPAAASATGIAEAAAWPSLLLALAILLCTLALQAGANVANDYADYVLGRDTAERLGPKRMASSGELEPGQVLVLALVAFGAAIIIGTYLVSVARLPVLLIGCASIAAAAGYSLLSTPRAPLGGGELAAFAFFGPVATAGTYYILKGAFSPAALLCGIAPGLHSLSLITVNNYRDIEEDRKSGKRTLVTRFGPPAARILYAGMIVAPMTGPIVLSASLPFSAAFALPLAALAPSLLLYLRLFRGTPGRWMNKLLFGTSLAMFAHALIFALSILIARVQR